MATETAKQPAAPRSKGGAAPGARALGSAASAAREKLRVRERQTAMLVGQLAAQLEDKQPGRIYAVKLTCTRYKSTGTIVFNQRRTRAPMDERDAGDDSDDDDSDDEGGTGSELVSGPPAHTVAASKSTAAAKTAVAAYCYTAESAKQRGGRGAAAGPSGGLAAAQATRQATAATAAQTAQGRSQRDLGARSRPAAARAADGHRKQCLGSL